MAYVGSYLWRLRQAVGSDLVLMPGAMVALVDGDRRVLMTKRADDGTWCLPAGAAETGGSFARTAIDELAEETGLAVTEQDLVPFGTLSEAALHTIDYPNGDVTHCFALLFLARSWTGEVRPDPEEAVEATFADLGSPPIPLPCPDRPRARPPACVPRLRPVSVALSLPRPNLRIRSPWVER